MVRLKIHFPEETPQTNEAPGWRPTEEEIKQAEAALERLFRFDRNQPAPFAKARGKSLVKKTIRVQNSEERRWVGDVVECVVIPDVKKFDESLLGMLFSIISALLSFLYGLLGLDESNWV